MPYGLSTYGVDDYALLYSDVGIRVSVPPVVISDHGLEVGFVTPVVVDHAIRIDFNLVESDHGVQVVVPGSVDSVHGVQVGIGLGQIQQLFPLTGNPSSNYYKYGTRIILHDTVKGPKDITQYVTNWSVSSSRGEPTTFSLKLADNARLFRPYLTSEDAYYDLFDGANFDDDNKVKRYITIEVALNGHVHMYPYFMATDYTWSLNEQGVAEISLTGSDFSELLLEEDQATEDFISGSTPVGGGVGGLGPPRVLKLYTIKSIISKLLTDNGISEDRQRLEFVDMDVHKFTPSGTPLDTIRDLLYYIQGEWYWDKDVFVAQDRNYSATGTGSWTLVDTNHVMSVSVKRSNRGIFNEFTGTKTEACTDILAEYECTGKECLGRQIISFEPARGATLRMIQMNCGSWPFTDWFMGGEDGRYVGHGAGGYQVLSDTCAFVYKQDIMGCFNPYVKAVVVGHRDTDVLMPAGYSNSFQCTVKSAASQAKYGVRRDKSPVTSTVWAREEDCRKTLKLLMEESARTAFLATIECPLLPGILPARTVKLINGYAGSTTGENYYIESVDAEGTSEGVYTMSLSLTRYRPEEVE